MRPPPLCFHGNHNPMFRLEMQNGPQQTTRIAEGPILTLERIERHQSGVYQCTADNGVGEPVSMEMKLDILCKYTGSIFAEYIFCDACGLPLDRNRIRIRGYEEVGNNHGQHY